MIYTSSILYETASDDIPYCPRKHLLRFSTLTCFTCDCYYDHPHAILLTRVAILFCCFLFRLIAIILGGMCANRFPPRAIAYVVFACISLLFAICTIVLEYRHHRRLWFYYPDGGSTLNRARRHRGFLPYSIINDQRTTSWRSSLCKRHNCQSRDFFHIIMYHSRATQFRVTNANPNQRVIGFHQTDQNCAFSISKTNFEPTEQARGLFGAGVYFATSIDHTEFKANYKGAYIIARVNLGRVYLTEDRGAQPTDRQSYDSIYFKHPNGSDEIVIFNPEFIEEWLIVVNQDYSITNGVAGVRDDIKDHFYAEVYKGCIF
ncbi:unnamed protein product [Adineta steineri]|uniref:PARP n=1 Tax=Adineta steineri TaxID=433720 RepID=A0A819SH67_9BILA|nr:unnamed protein product [Adineta steineri]CAF4061529.1 unnamed protein product [Adineta steineri]